MLIHLVRKSILRQKRERPYLQFIIFLKMWTSGEVYIMHVEKIVCFPTCQGPFTELSTKIMFISFADDP